MEYNAIFRTKSAVSVEEAADKLYRFVSLLSKYAPECETWYLGGDSKEEALQYIAIDKNGPTTQGLVILRKENKDKEGSPAIGIWNGHDDEDGDEDDIGADITLYIYGKGVSTCDFATELESINNVDCAIEVVKALVSIWDASVVTVGGIRYDLEKVFQDRPGVGWMIYLPRILTADQVPEARRLVPVMDSKKQIGTIVVSVADDVFDVDNKDHINAANSIEVRLVDQDLLPLIREL